jgi:outer membrane protein TolC
MSSNPSADTSFEALPVNLNPLTSLNAVNQSVVTDLTNHPQVQWHAVQVQKSQGESTLTRAQAKPKSTLFLGAINEQDAQTNAHSQLIAEVSIPLGTPASYQADMAEQAYLLTEQTSRLAQVKQALQQSLAQHILQLQAHQAVQHSLEEVATQSLQAYQIAKAAYQQGGTAIHSLLLAQQQMEQAALDLALSQAEYGQKVSELLQTLGNNLVTPMVSMPITPITKQSSFK